MVNDGLVLQIIMVYVDQRMSWMEAAARPRPLNYRPIAEAEDNDDGQRSSNRIEHGNIQTESFI